MQLFRTPKAASVTVVAGDILQEGQQNALPGSSNKDALGATV